VLELILGVVLAAGAVAFVLRPIFRPAPPEAAAGGCCARCGTSLEREARYCHACGARVAA
jgi:hypothetical protein